MVAVNEHGLQRKTAKVMVVEALSSRRFALIEVLKQLGFTWIKRSANINEAINFAENAGERPDWVITSLFDDQPINALIFLQKILRDWPQCRVSLFYEPSQEYSLKKAFELGLFSCHLKFAEIDKTKTSLENLLERGQYWKWEDSLIAGDYLRDLLKKDEKDGVDGGERLSFDRQLLSLFPQVQEPLILEIAEYLHQKGKSQLAVSMLSKVGEFALQYRQKADRLIEEASQQAARGQDGKVFAQTWGIKRCVLVDSDEASRNLLKDALEELGVEEVECYGDGEKAYESLKDRPEPDLIVQEWRVPKVKGDRLVQMIRLLGFKNVPIIVCSGVIKTSDRFVLREMGVSEIIVKPQPQKKLVSMLMQIVEEEKRPKGERATELRIRKALSLGQIKSARHLFKTHFSDGKTSEKIQLLLGAEIAFAEGRLPEAEQLATQGLILSGEDTLVMNLLGKINLKLGRWDKAEGFFSKAEKLSPGNVERLCSLAEVKSESSDLGGADQLLQKAATLAPDAKVIQETKAKVAVASHDEKRLSALMNQSGRELEVVALLNNRAVGLAARGQPREGVKLYNKAIKVLPKSMAQYAPTILYNMALAMLKAGSLDKEALLVLTKASQMDGGFLASKIASLKSRLEMALESGEPMVLLTGAPSDKAHQTPQNQGPHKEDQAIDSEEGIQFRPEDVELAPGDFCLVKIYTASGPQDARIGALMAGVGSKHQKVS